MLELWLCGFRTTEANKMTCSRDEPTMKKKETAWWDAYDDWIAYGEEGQDDD